MLGSPPDLVCSDVIAAMRAIDGVADVHHIHLWQMREHEVALDCHVVLTDEVWTNSEAIKSTIKATLAERFGVTHSSLEFEHTDRAHEGANLYGHGSAEKGDDHAH